MTMRAASCVDPIEETTVIEMLLLRLAPATERAVDGDHRQVRERLH